MDQKVVTARIGSRRHGHRTVADLHSTENWPLMARAAYPRTLGDRDLAVQFADAADWESRCRFPDTYGLVAYDGPVERVRFLLWQFDVINWLTKYKHKEEMVHLHEIHELLSRPPEDADAQLFAIHQQLTGQVLQRSEHNTNLVRAYLSGYVQTRLGDYLPTPDQSITDEKVSKTLLREMFDLITIPRNTRQNRRMFELYNQMTGRKWRPCWCSSKIDAIHAHFRGVLLENGFIEQ
jgi:hypothetical protein